MLIIFLKTGWGIYPLGFQNLGVLKDLLVLPASHLQSEVSRRGKKTKYPQNEKV